MANKTKTVEIILCTECKGTGSNTRQELVDYHVGEYEYHHTVCLICRGAGRLKVTTEVTREPYENPIMKELVFNKLQGKK
jgi:hypothetical protein